MFNLILCRIPLTREYGQKNTLQDIQSICIANIAQGKQLIVVVLSLTFRTTLTPILMLLLTLMLMPPSPRNSCEKYAKKLHFLPRFFSHSLDSPLSGVERLGYVVAPILDSHNAAQTQAP